VVKTFCAMCEAYNQSPTEIFQQITPLDKLKKQIEKYRLEGNLQPKKHIIFKRKEVKMQELKKEGKIKVSELTPHPKNNYYFDDMEGDSWDSLLQSISTSGITNAITITDKKVIISGHQRVRACKVLGIEEISYKMIHYENEENEIKDLIESNLRQRVLGNTNPVKLGKCFTFLNEYYGIQNGGDRKSDAKILHLKNKENPNTQSELADSYGISHQTMNNYMRLANTIPELEDLIDTGIVTKDTALAMIRNLSDEEQLELISSLDTTKRITKKQMEKYIEEIKSLKENPPKPQDYESTKRQLQNYQSDYADLKRQFDNNMKELQNLKKQIETMNDNSPYTQYEKKLKDSSLLFCSKVATFIEQVGGYAWLIDKINEIPELEREGYIKSIHVIKSWADTMEYNINNKTKEIE